MTLTPQDVLMIIKEVEEEIDPLSEDEDDFRYLLCEQRWMLLKDKLEKLRVLR